MSLGDNAPPFLSQLSKRSSSVGHCCPIAYACASQQVSECQTGAHRSLLASVVQYGQQSAANLKSETHSQRTAGELVEHLTAVHDHTP